MNRRKILATVALALSVAMLGACLTPPSPVPAESPPVVSTSTPAEQPTIEPTPLPTPEPPPATPSPTLSPAPLPSPSPVAGTPTAESPITGSLALSEIDSRQPPQEITFQDCPPGGSGGDIASNLLKNRVDKAPHYYPVDFDAVAQLPWPAGIENRIRANWTITDTQEVTRYEGIPIAVEGYLWGVEPNASGERTNCGAKTAPLIDWHIWLIRAPEDDRTHSIVVETTPRVRVDHPDWTLAAVRKLRDDKPRVRISGWLFLDPEHPEELPKKKGIHATRGTIWEIHPIMKIEVWQDGQWVSLDSSSSP